MMRRIAVGVAALGLLSGPGFADAAGLADAAGVSHARISVSPAVGSAKTRFDVTFEAPNAAGGTTGRTYQVQATGPASKSLPCDRTPTATVGTVRARASVKLFAGGHGLYPGTYHGTVRETQRPVCGPPVACPQYVVVLGTVGRFKFRVR